MKKRLVLLGALFLLLGNITIASAQTVEQCKAISNITGGGVLELPDGCYKHTEVVSALRAFCAGNISDIEEVACKAREAQIAQPDPSITVTPSKETVGPCIGANCTYDLLEPLPGLKSVDANFNIGTWVNTMVRIIIGIIGILAVVMIVIGGIQYMTTDAIGKKESGKETIQGAIFGVVLALGAYLLLRTINPQLVSIELQPGTAKTGQVSVAIADEVAKIYDGKSNINDVVINRNSDIACIRNNNYGNIVPVNPPWNGQIGIDPATSQHPAFAIFENPVMGIRALFVNLKTQYMRPTDGSKGNHFKTLLELFKLYDSVTYQTYAQTVSKNSGIGINDDIKLVKDGVVDKKVLYSIARTIFLVECTSKPGVHNTKDSVLDDAYQKAY